MKLYLYCCLLCCCIVGYLYLNINYENEMISEVQLNETTERLLSPEWQPYLHNLQLDCDITNNYHCRMPKTYPKWPTFVTAFSDNHFKEAVNLLNNFKEIFVNNSEIPHLVVYNLGLNMENIKFIFQNFDNFVELREFDFHTYPSYVSLVNEYRWKPLIMARMLSESSAIWWLDSSIVFNDSFLKLAKNIHVWTRKQQTTTALFDSTGHSIFAATNPLMYKYLPIPFVAAKQLTMYGANVILMYRSIESLAVLTLWVRCALIADCMSPKYSRLQCKFNNKYDHYGNCHRFDQSALNIILATKNTYDINSYVYSGTLPFSVRRIRAKIFNLF